MRTFTPKIGIMVVVLILIISAVILVANRNEHTSTTSSASQRPLRSDSTLAAKAEKSGEIGEYYDGTSSASASSSATPVPKAPVLTIYTYPGSETKSSTARKLVMETTATPEEVSDWYKKKIESLNFNAKSFSQTTTNGNVLNKLSAAKPGEKLEITIKKDQKASKVSITVDRPQ